MPQYKYQASSQDGQSISGELTAENVSEAIVAIESRGLTVQSISMSSIPEVPTPQIRPQNRGPAASSSLERHFDSALDRRQVLIPALEALASELPAGRSRREIRQLVTVIGTAQSGAELSRSNVARQWLPLLNATLSGDASSGYLSDVIANASRASENRRRRRRVLAYPIVVMLITLLLFAFLAVVVVPTFAEMFREFGLVIPATTLLVVAAAEQLSNQPVQTVVIVALLVCAIYGVMRVWVHFALTTRLLGTFVAGNSASVNSMSSLTSQLADLLTIDVPLPDALWIAGQGCRHYHYKNVAEHLARYAHDQNRPLSESIDARYLPANVILALQAGPDGGPSIALLRELSSIYADRAAQRIDWSSGAMAQFAIVFVGIAVAFVVISLFSPLVSLVTSLS